jgi:hypothetical protein
LRWLIDGYNVIRRDAELRSRETESLASGRTALLHLLARLAQESGESFIVVFDGDVTRAVPPPGGRVQVVFSRHPESADTVLGRLAAQWRDAAIVVSSDRAVQTAARRAGCAALTAEAFLAAATGDADSDDADEEPDEPASRVKRGNPRRRSKEERSAQRALARLRRR